LKKFAVDIFVGGMNGEKILSRFKRAEIPLLRAEKRAKNLSVVRIYRKDLQKAIAILNGSCYNILKIVPVGAYAAFTEAKKRLSFFICALLFIVGLFFTDGLVLRISYSGSGAYYKKEAGEILNSFGIGEMRFFSEADVPMATSAILSLQGVSFCSIKLDGYILKVEIAVNAFSLSAVSGGLYSSSAGIVREITVLSGTPLVKVGDGVLKGDELVAPYNVGTNGEKINCVVSARASLECSVSSDGETKEEAAERAKFLADGEIEEVFISDIEGGYRATVIYNKILSINF